MAADGPGDLSDWREAQSAASYRIRLHAAEAAFYPWAIAAISRFSEASTPVWERALLGQGLRPTPWSQRMEEEGATVLHTKVYPVADLVLPLHVHRYALGDGLLAMDDPTWDSLTTEGYQSTDSGMPVRVVLSGDVDIPFVVDEPPTAYPDAALWSTLVLSISEK